MTSEVVRVGEEYAIKGKVYEKIGILLKGLMYASFCPDDKIDEKVSRFFYSPRNIIVTSFESFERAVPSTESILALENSYLLRIKKKDLEQIEFKL